MLDVGAKLWPCSPVRPQAALLGKLRRLDPAISTEEQYMVDVSWRQDVPRCAVAADEIFTAGSSLSP